MPKNTLHNRHLAAYGVQGMEMEGVNVQYAGCPAVYKAKYVDFSMKEPTNPMFEYGSLIHDALYLAEEEGLPLLPDALEKAAGRTSMPVDAETYQEAVDDLTAFMERGGLNLATVAVEQHLTMPLMEHNGEEWFFGGILDWLGVDTEDPNTLYFADYKTNRSPPRQSDLDKDSQFTGYACLVRANAQKYLPDADPALIRVVGIMEAVKWYTLRTEREDWRMDAYEDWLRAMCRRIVDDEAGDPVLNEGCGGCQLKYDCKEFRKLPGRGDTIADRMSKTTDLTQRVHLMQQAQLVQKAMKGVVDEVQAELKAAVRGAADPIVINGVAYHETDQFETEPNKLGLYEALGLNDFLNIVSVTAYKLEEVVKRRPELKSAMESLMPRIPKAEKKLTAKKAE